MTENPLSTLTFDIEAHWREHRPVMVAELEAEGRLAKAIEAAASQTEAAIQNAVTTGTPFWDAWQIYREEWAFLPVEPQADAADDDDDEVPWLREVGYFDNEADEDNDDLFDPYADDDDDLEGKDTTIKTEVPCA